MSILLILFHIVACLILILVVLLQSGKAADLAGAFGGGGSQTAFGARGAQTVLAKLTTGAAIVFMCTSLGLGILSSRQSESIFEGTPEEPGVEETGQPGAAVPQEIPPASPAVEPGTVPDTDIEADPDSAADTGDQEAEPAEDADPGTDAAGEQEN